MNLNRKSPALFEIGAGSGEFLREASTRGWKVSGIEPGRVGAENAKKFHGIEIECAHVENWSFQQSYNVIVMRHVLEHLNNAEDVLRTIFETALPDRGLLYLKLPRVDSWEARLFNKFWHGYDLPRHRIHFSSSGIEKLLTRIGFSRVHVRSDIVPLDIIRSAEYAMAGRYLPKLDALLMPLVQPFALMMSPMGSGRMIVIAKKGTP